MSDNKIQFLCTESLEFERCFTNKEKEEEYIVNYCKVSLVGWFEKFSQMAHSVYKSLTSDDIDSDSCLHF